MLEPELLSWRSFLHDIESSQLKRSYEESQVRACRSLLVVFVGRSVVGYLVFMMVVF